MNAPQPAAGALPKNQEKLRAQIVNSFRARRTTPREGLSPENPRAWEDNAPDWLWQLVDAVLLRTKAESDYGAGLTMRAIAWCQRGDAPSRSAHLRAVLDLWLGDRVPMLHHFLADAEKTNGGRVTARRPLFLYACDQAITKVDEKQLPIEATIKIAGSSRLVTGIMRDLRRMIHNGAVSLPEPAPGAELRHLTPRDAPTYDAITYEQFVAAAGTHLARYLARGADGQPGASGG